MSPEDVVPIANHFPEPISDNKQQICGYRHREKSNNFLLFRHLLKLAGFTAVLTMIGASGSYFWALFGSAFCKIFAKHTRAVNLIMAFLLVYYAISLFL